jgi:RHS repeat-associated protein
MNRRLRPDRFRQALHAGLLPFVRRQPPPTLAPFEHASLGGLIVTGHYHAQGNLLSFTDVMTFTYSGAFGDLAGSSSTATAPNSGAGERHGYTGRALDPDTGLEYNRARAYDPTPGRWLIQDPSAFAAEDENLSRFVADP